MVEIDDAPSIPDEIEAVVFPTTSLARTLAPLIDDDVAVLSPDDAFGSKMHLHGADDGAILTQLNVGASVDWETTLDLRIG